MRKPIRTITSAAVIAMLSNHAINAGGFSLYTESSPAAIGNFAAGIAAEGADASIGWYNPAGLVLLKDQQIVFGGVGVFPSTKLTGTSTYTTQNPLDPAVPLQYTQSFTGLQGAESAVVPSLHYARPLGERAAFGLSFVSPFGLSTKYGKESPVRYAATLSQLQTVTVSPELGGLLTDNLSIGAGLDLQYAQVKFNSMIGSPAFLQVVDVPPTALDSQSFNTGYTFGLGFHAGALLMFNERHSRVGLNYQSSINHQFFGASELTGRLASPGLNVLDPLEGDINAQFSTDALYSNGIELPAIVTLSGYQDVNEKLALLGSVVFTGWHDFKTITLNNIAAGVPVPGGDGEIIQTVVNSTSIEDYRDTWRFALGANYRINEQWMMRVGGGYDQTPTINAQRDVRLPDSDRWALSIGTHYQMWANVGFDLGYTYLFGANDALVNKTQAIGETSTYNVNAVSKNHAQLLGLQVVWKMDEPRVLATK